MQDAPDATVDADLVFFLLILVLLGLCAEEFIDGSDGLPSSTGQCIGLDIGFTATLRGKNRIGVYYENINAPSMGRGLTSSYLPQKLSIGISYRPYKSLTTSMDVERVFGKSDIQYQGSIKYEILNINILLLHC
mgnify:CR=1 FL=1